MEGGSGIYIRDANQLTDSIFTVCLDVSFPKKLEHYADMPKFSMNIVLTPSEEWVRSAEFVTVSTGKKVSKAAMTGEEPLAAI